MIFPILTSVLAVGVFGGYEDDGIFSTLSTLRQRLDNTELPGTQLPEFEQNSKDGVIKLYEMIDAIAEGKTEEIYTLIEQDERGFFGDRVIKGNAPFVGAAQFVDKLQGDLALTDGYTFFDYVQNGRQLPENLQNNAEVQQKLDQILQSVASNEEVFQNKYQKGSEIVVFLFQVIFAEVGGPKLNLNDGEVVLDEQEGDTSYIEQDSSRNPQLYKRGLLGRRGRSRNRGVQATKNLVHTGQACTNQARDGFKAVLRGIRDAVVYLIRIGVQVIKLVFALVTFLLMLVALNGVALLTCVPLIAVGAVGVVATHCVCGCIDCGLECITCGHLTLWKHITDFFSRPFEWCVDVGCAGIAYAWETPIDFYSNQVKDSLSLIFHGKRGSHTWMPQTRYTEIRRQQQLPGMRPSYN